MGKPANQPTVARIILIILFSLVHERDCHAEFILSAREGLAMTKSRDDTAIGSLRGLPAVLEEGGASGRSNLIKKV
jgi:hypothetical protein